MARAKRTDRADARRRYRLTHDETDMTESEDLEPVPNVLASSRVPTKGPVAARPMSFTDSMRNSWHRPDVRADIEALPWLLRSRAFLVPLALVVVGVAALTAAPTNPAAGLFFQLMVLPPAMAPIFITGFFAKRASYLLGLIIAVIDVAGYAVFVYSALPALSGDPVTAARQQELVFSAVAVGPLSGIFFAAGAAWYRRFLAFSSAQRARSRGADRTKAKRQTRG
ncbi:MAG: hypothetical protein V4515_13980 [Chloroflexota bacterium]